MAQSLAQARSQIEGLVERFTRNLETSNARNKEAHVHVEFILNNVYGVDIDRQAVEVTRLSLLLKVLEGETE